jgi:hypothetical protein
MALSVRSIACVSEPGGEVVARTFVAFIVSKQKVFSPQS